MVSAAFVVALLAMIASFTAVNLFSSLDHHLGAMTSAQAVQALLPLAAMGGLLGAVASIYRQLLHHAAAEAAGAGAMDVAAAAVCAVAGVLEFFIFVCKPAAQGDEDGGMARELGMAAVHVLPAAATATFFLGVTLLFAHVRAGGGAVAGDAPIQILVKTALGATAVLVGLMALAP